MEDNPNPPSPARLKLEGQVKDLMAPVNAVTEAILKWRTEGRFQQRPQMPPAITYKGLMVPEK